MKIQSSKKHKATSRSKSNLQSLTAAALILPGLLQVSAYAADDDEVDFQYSHYQEGNRAVYIDPTMNPAYLSGTSVNGLHAIEADSLRGSARISLTDRIKFGFNYTQDTWGGATPIASAPVISGAMFPSVNQTTGVLTGASPFVHNLINTPFFIDKKGNLFKPNSTYDPNLGYIYTLGKIANQVTDVLAGASAETRNQGDFKLGYDWDNASVTGGGGISVENDYDSRFGNLGTRFDFNQKRTSVNVGHSYTNSYTHATMDPYPAPWTDPGPYGANNAIATGWQTGNLTTYQTYSPLTEGTLTSNYSRQTLATSLYKLHRTRHSSGLGQQSGSNPGLDQKFPAGTGPWLYSQHRLFDQSLQSGVCL
jgi:hypothetical protein